MKKSITQTWLKAAVVIAVASALIFSGNAAMTNNVTTQSKQTETVQIQDFVKYTNTPQPLVGDDILMASSAGDDIYPGVTYDKDEHYVVSWTNTPSFSEGKWGISYSEGDPLNAASWTSYVLTLNGNDWYWDTAKVAGDEPGDFDGLMGVYASLTDETVGYYLIDDVTTDPTGWLVYGWQGGAPDTEYACIEDSGFYGGLYYPQYVGPFNFYLYHFQESGFDIPGCPVFMRTDVRGGAGGVFFFDAQSEEKTAPAANPSMWPLSDRIQTAVQYNDPEGPAKIVWKKVVPLEETDYEYTPYQDTLVNGTHPTIAGFEDGHVVIIYADPADSTIKCLTSDDDGDTWSASTIIADGNYPDVCALYDQVEEQDYFYCAYVDEGDVYIQYSDDYGATWTEFADNPINDVSGSVAEQNKCVDIHNKGGIVWTDNRGTDIDVYFDQYFAPPTLAIQISDVAGGLSSVSAVLTNTGDIQITDASWEISVKGGLLGRIDVVTPGDVDTLDVGATQEIATDGSMFGLGKLTITIKASYTPTLEGTALLIGPFVLNVQTA